MFNYYYIIDLSYILFYSAFSAFNFYKSQMDLSQSQLNPEFNPTADEEFNNIFLNSIKFNIMTPAQKIFPFVDTTKFIFCMDCSRKNIWRRNIYPNYKMNRDTKDTSKDEFNISSVFQYAYNILVPMIKSEYNCLQVSCGCAEGDDVIAVLSKKILNDNPENKVIIISSDRDMIQLCQDRLTLITANGIIRSPKEDIMKMINNDKLEDDINAKEFLLFKILLGDSSDNIPHIKPGLGPKKAYKLMKDKDQLKNLLKEDITIANSFKRNKQLISMEEIPIDIQQMILNDYENAINNQKSNII